MDIHDNVTRRHAQRQDGDNPRHPELVSGSRADMPDDSGKTPEVLKQVQDDSADGNDGEFTGEDSSPPQPPLALPPGYRRRSGGWSKAKMRAFLEALVETASVSDAARAVNMSRQSAYRLRARLTGTPFDLAWEAAFEFCLRQLSQAALDRAINGTTEPVFHGNEQIGEKRVYHDMLTRFMLDNPARLGRTPVAREHGLLHWDDILDRVEHGELDWARPDDAATDAAENEAAATAFVTQRSDYGAQWVWELEQYRIRREIERSGGVPKKW